MGVLSDWGRRGKQWRSPQPQRDNNYSASSTNRRDRRNRSNRSSDNFFVRFIKLQRSKQLHNSRTWWSLSIYPDIFWTRYDKSNNNSKSNNNTKRHRYNKYLYAIATIGSLLSPNVALAQGVGGVSATANPIANSSGSVTNQAIQVLQGPYVTNTYGNGIQCQGPTLNITPYLTRTQAWQLPFESVYQDPVYTTYDGDDDGYVDNPGEIEYYVPTRTGQKDNHSYNAGISATISWPLDKQLQGMCKDAANANIALMNQAVSNKRLDFEIARLKNCGELMKAGIMFHKKSPYYAVCADVVLVNPPGVVGQHQHIIPQGSLTRPSGGAEDLGVFSIGEPSSSDSSSSTLEEPDLSSNGTGLLEFQIGTVSEESSPSLPGTSLSTSSHQVSQCEGGCPQAVLLGGQKSLQLPQFPQ